MIVVPTPKEPPSGTIVGGSFTLLSKLGQGAMGAVYEARQESLGRLVALKILLQNSLEQEDLRAASNRLRDEAQAASAIHHPGLVRVIDADDDPSLGPFVVYELLPGSTLADEVHRRGAIPWPEILERIARPILSGLQALHNAGIIHRDIKPTNVLLDHNGSYRLGDFGLSYFQYKRSHTVEGIVLGTPGFVAPERLKSGLELPQGDIYSLCRLLSLSLGETMPDVLAQGQELLIAKRLESRGLPPKAAQALSEGLSDAPEARPSQPVQLLEVLSQEPSPMKSDKDADFVRSCQPTSRRLKFLVMMAAAAIGGWWLTSRVNGLQWPSTIGSSQPLKDRASWSDDGTGQRRDLLSEDAAPPEIDQEQGPDQPDLCLRCPACRLLRDIQDLYSPEQIPKLRVNEPQYWRAAIEFPGENCRGSWLSLLERLPLLIAPAGLAASDSASYARRLLIHYRSGARPLRSLGTELGPVRLNDSETTHLAKLLKLNDEILSVLTKPWDLKVQRTNVLDQIAKVNATYWEIESFARAGNPSLEDIYAIAQASVRLANATNKMRTLYPNDWPPLYSKRYFLARAASCVLALLYLNTIKPPDTDSNLKVQQDASSQGLAYMICCALQLQNMQDDAASASKQSGSVGSLAFRVRVIDDTVFTEVQALEAASIPELAPATASLEAVSRDLASIPKVWKEQVSSYVVEHLKIPQWESLSGRAAGLH